MKKASTGLKTLIALSSRKVMDEMDKKNDMVNVYLA